MSAVELARALRRRELSAVEALQAVIDRCEAVNPHINALALPLYDRARAAAQRADTLLARGEGGPLCGVPLTVKDSQWLAGVRCANGSRTLADFVPQETSAALARLEEADGVIFAKTTCPEFSYIGVTTSEFYGTTANPWNQERTPGGSSGGAGAAVAAGLGPLSLGGDGGGSVRIPAAFCGLVGFKPSFGVVPREPCFPTWKSLVAYGPLARSVADAKLMFEVMAGFHSDDRHSIEPRTYGNHANDDLALEDIAVVASEDMGFAPLDRDVRQAFQGVIRQLEASGTRVIWDHPGHGSSVEPWAITAFGDAWVSGREDLELRPETIGEIARELLAFGSAFGIDDFVAAQHARERIHRSYQELFERSGASVLLTPTLGCEAFGHGRRWPERIGNTEIEPPWVDWAGFLYDANLAGLPACAIPIGLGDEALPVSLQILGRRGEDRLVLAVAERLEEIIGWPGRYPELAGAAEQRMNGVRLSA